VRPTRNLVFEKYRDSVDHHDARFTELVQERIADEETQEKMLAIIKSILIGRGQ
jgi:hypothetical protein